MRSRGAWAAGLAAVALLAVTPAHAQDAAPAESGGLAAPLAALKDLSPEITQTLDSTHWQKWKLKQEQKDIDDRALTSLHRDLDEVLPPLLDAAQAHPQSVAAGLAVYRNVNAFYNVLLRLEQTAEFVAKDDAQPLNDELSRLEIVRNMIGEQLLALARKQDSDLAETRAGLAARLEKSPGGEERPRRVVADDAAPGKKTSARKSPPAKAGSGQSAAKGAAKPGSAAKPAAAKPSAATQP